MKKLLSLLVSWSLVFLPISLQALPSGQKVANGIVSFTTNSNTMNITASNKAIINYDSFNINQNEVVNFLQPNANSIVLNKVVKSNPSSIMGALNANGKVFLINPAGIVFGENSSINTSSFLATTLDIKNSDFINDKFLFNQVENQIPSYILQKGKISVSPEGFVVLASPLVKSDGLIVAKSGQITIGAVDNFYLNFDQSGLIKFDYKPTEPTKEDVILSSKVAQELMQDVVNNEKIDEAINITEENGVIKLVGGSGTALIDGNINADEKGSIEVEANKYIGLLNNANLSANGAGNIVVFSQQDAYSSKGAILSAKEGGFIELSARKKVIYDGSYVDTSSQNGEFGLFYMDPEYIEVVSNNVNISSNYFLEATKSILLKSGISIQTNGGDITLDAPSITLEENSKLLSGSGDIKLNADSTENASIDIQSGVVINGANINIKAKTYRTSEFDSDSDDPLLKAMEAVGDFVIDMPLTPIAYKNAQATSNIDIADAIITGQNIDISSEATSDVSVSALFEILALSYGKSYSNSSLHVNSGARLDSTGDITLKSEATSINNVTGRATNILSDTEKQKQANFSLVYSKTKTDSKVIVDNGVNIKADNLKLIAIGNKDITTTATGSSFSAGTLGAAVAWSDSESNIKSILSGSVNANSIEVSSKTNIERIKTSSSAGVGNGFAYKFLLESSGDKTAAMDKTKVVTNSKAPTTNEKSGVKKIALSAAFSYSHHENNSEAKITDATVQSNGDITVNSNIIYGENGSYEENGDVSIIGDRGIKTVAIATIDSTEKNQKENSVSGAVVLTDIVNNSDAFIDDDVIIDAIGGDIGIYSKMYLGYKIVWSNIENFDSIEDIVPKVLDANFRGRLFTSYAQSNAQGTKNSLSGSYNHFKLTSNVDAHIGQNALINQNTGNGKIEVLADNDIEALNFAGVIGWTYFGTKAGSVGIGGSYLDVDYENNTKVYIENGTIIKATDVKVAAIKNSNNLSISTAGGSGKYAISGSFSALKTDDDTYAYIDGVTITTSEGINNKYYNDELDTNLRVNAQNRTEFSNRTGGIIKGKNLGVGASGSINDIKRDTKAYINNTTINRTSALLSGLDYIKAYNSGFINTYAISGVIASPEPSTSNDTQSTPTSKATFGLAVSGDASVNEINDKANAYIDGTTFTQSLGDVDLLAKNNTEIGSYSGSGAFNFTQKSVGLAGSYSGNYFSNEANAYIKNSTFHVNNLDIKAQNSGTISTLSGSGSIGTGIASLAGSVSINEISNQTNSYINNSDITLNENIELNSLDDTSIKSLAGAASINKAFGIGFSYANNKITNSIASYITNSSLYVDDISILSKQSNDIQNISATIGAALSGAAAVGTVSINEIDNLLDSYIINNINPIVSSGDISIEAFDESDIESIAGYVSGASALGVGGGILHNKISNDLNAYIKDSSSINSQNLIIKAVSDKEIIATTLGGAGAGTASVSGSVLINKIEDDIDAYVDDSTILIDKSMLVHAIEQDKITTYGGTASGAGTVGIGGTVVTNKLTSNISAKIKDSTVDVEGSSTLDIPTRDGKNYNDKDSYSGLSILALANEDVKVYTANASGAGTASFTASANFNTISNKLYSYILNSVINQNSAIESNPNQSILVRAISNNTLNINGGGITGAGVVGIGGSLNTSYIKNETNAYIDTSFVDAKDLIEVRAQSTEDIDSKVASGAGSGTVSLAGSVSIVDIENENEAKIDKSTVSSQNDLSIVSKDNVEVKTKVGTLSGSGVVGVGGSVVINKIKNSSIAHVDNSAINAKDKLYMYSSNYAKLSNDVASSSLGSFGGSGATVINTIDSTTKSYTHHEDNLAILINQNPNFVVDNQKVDIEAVDYAKVDDSLGSAGLGLVGVGGSVNITTLKNNTDAYLGKDTVLFAKNDLDLLARSTKDITINSLASAGGKFGVAGSVVLANIGASIDQDALDAQKNTESILNKTIDSLSNARLGESPLATDTISSLNDDKSNITFDSVFNFNPTITNKTKAHINSNTNINVGNDINIKAENIISNLLVQSGGGAGGVLGVGGAVGLVYLGTYNQAYTEEDVTIDAKNLILYANYDANEIKIKSYAGSAGLVGLGADVSRLLHSYTNSAILGTDNFIVATNGIDIKSYTDENIYGRGYGGNIGAGVAGVSKVDVDSEGVTSSIISEQSKLYAQGDDGIDIISSYSTDVDAYTASAALGGIEIQGTVSDIEVRPTITSQIGDNVKLGTKIGDINIKSLSYDTLLSKALGLNLGGISIGSSYARAYNRAVISSIIGNNVLINAGNDFRVLTYENRYVDTGDKIDSRFIEAEAISAVGTLVGGIGSKSTTSSHSHLKTDIGQNSDINAKDDIVIKTKSYAKTKSTSNGHSYGVASSGFTGAYTYNDGDVYINLGDSSNLVALNDILINAYAKKNAYATSYGGVGGLLTGSGTKVDAQMGNLIYINIDDNTRVIANNGDINILATGNIDSLLYANTTSVGFVTANSVKSNIDIDKQDIQIDIGNSEIVGKDVTVESKIEYLHASSESYSKTITANSYSRAYAYLTLASNVGVNIDNATIIGYDSVNIKSNQHTDDVFARTTATSTISPSFIGSLYATVENNPTFKSNVTVKNSTTIQSDNINIKGSAPNMRKVADYPDNYNYVKYPNVINHSVGYWVEKKVWEFFEGFWQWVTHKELKHHWSFSSRVKKGYFRSQKVINVKNSVSLLKSPKLSNEIEYKDAIKTQLNNDFGIWRPMSISGKLSFPRGILTMIPIPVNDDVGELLADVTQNNDYEVDEGYFDDIDIENIPDDFEELLEETITIPNYLPDYREMIAMYKDSPFVIIENKIVGGKLLDGYIRMMLIKVEKFNPVFQFNLPKIETKNKLITLK